MSYRFSRRSVLGAMGATALPWATNAATAGTGPDADFADLSKRWLDAMARFSPVSATQLGDHRFDGQIDDLSAKGRAAAAASTRRFLAELDAMPKSALSRDSQIDAVILDNQLRYDLWTGEVLQSWAWDPMIYNEIAGDSLYALMAREFAPLTARLGLAVARMEKLPEFLAQARRNLKPTRVPLIYAQTVAKQNAGLTSIVAELITPHAADLPQGAQVRLAAATAGLTKAVAEHQTWIDTILVPNAKGEFRLGDRLYDEKLTFALNSSLDRKQIRARAEAAVIATRAEMYVLARSVLAGKTDAPVMPEAPTPAQQQTAIKAALDLAAADHPAREDLVDAAKSGLAAATAFVKAKDLITLPEAAVKVILMPKFQQGVSVAYCDSPGALDRNLTTFYAVSPIPDDWTAERTASFLREYNRRAIDDIATHEAMPGHYVQLAHSNACPSILRAVLSNGPFVEGWAVYGESVMAQEGFLGGDPLYKLVVLKTKLRSITNAIIDQAVHVDGMSQADAMTFMMKTAFQEEGEAAGKWIRASVSSAQLPYYFVGSEEHWAARREAEKRWGADFTLKRYHDTILSFGSPPVRLARAAMFGEAIG